MKVHAPFRLHFKSTGSSYDPLTCTVVTRALASNAIDELLSGSSTDGWLRHYEALHEITHFLQYRTTVLGFLFEKYRYQYLACTDVLAGDSYRNEQEFFRRLPLLELPSSGIEEQYYWLRAPGRYYRDLARVFGGNGRPNFFETPDGKSDIVEAIRVAEAHHASPFYPLWFFYSEGASDPTMDPLISQIAGSTGKQVLESHAHAFAYLILREFYASHGEVPPSQLDEYFESSTIGPYKPFRQTYARYPDLQAIRLYCFLCEISLNPWLPRYGAGAYSLDYFHPARRLAQLTMTLDTLGDDLALDLSPTTSTEASHALAKAAERLDFILPHSVEVQVDTILEPASRVAQLLRIGTELADKYERERDWVRPLQRCEFDALRSMTSGLEVRKSAPALLGIPEPWAFMYALKNLGFPAQVTEVEGRRIVSPRSALFDERDSEIVVGAADDKRTVLHTADWVSCLDFCATNPISDVGGKRLNHRSWQVVQALPLFLWEYNDALGREAPLVRPNSALPARGRIADRRVGWQ